jgi:chemotaxis protein histidine kinase CheA
LISLLKDEFFIHEKFIKVQYKVIGKDSFMLILSDITQNKYLNDKIKDEQQMYKMVITVITFFEQFNEVKEGYQTFTKEIEKYKTLEMLPMLRREIHTYKGLFAQLELLNIVKKLHVLESTIDYSLKINRKPIYGIGYFYDLNAERKLGKHPALALDIVPATEVHEPHLPTANQMIDAGAKDAARIRNMKLEIESLLTGTKNKIAKLEKAGKGEEAANEERNYEAAKQRLRDKYSDVGDAFDEYFKAKNKR